MNHIYRLVFNRALGLMQVASELTSGAHGGAAGSPAPWPARSLLAISIALAAGSAAAGPTGEVVRGGTVDITGNAGHTVVSQGSARAFIDWADFSIGNGESVTFNYALGHGVTLNRVVGNTHSQILGDLNATNGTVFLINPSGIVFGSNAIVNVGTLIASTLSLDMPDPVAGFMTGPSSMDLAATNPPAAIVNNGIINASGQVLLFAGAIDNGASATISADGGVDMIASRTAQLYQGATLTGMAMTQADGAAIQNFGLLRSSNGNVSLVARPTLATVSNAINTSNLIQANALTINGGTGNIVLGGAIQVQDLTVDSNSAIQLNAAITTGSATLSGNGITQATGASSRLTTTGTTMLDAGNGNLIMGSTGNDLRGAVSADGAAVTLYSASGLNVTSLQHGANNAVRLRTGGNLSLSATAIDTGTAALELSAGGVLTTSAALRGADVSLHGGDGLTLAHDVTGTTSVALSSDQAITQTGGGISTALLSLDGGSATLDGSANAIAQLGDVDLASGLTLINSQAITQATGTTIAVDGIARFSAGNADITLDNAGNAFGDVVHLDGGALAINNGGALALGPVNGTSLNATSQGKLTLDTTTLTGSLTLTSNGGLISQTGRINATAGSHLIDAGAGDIRLDRTDNTLGGLQLTGDDVTIAAQNLTLSMVDAGTLDATSRGPLTFGNVQVDDLTARSTEGSIGQINPLQIGGDSSFTAAESIVLVHPGNDFGGDVSVAGAGIRLRAANDLKVVSVSNAADHTLSLVAGRALSLSGGAIDTGTAALELSAGGALTTSAALRGADVSLHGGDGLTLAHDVTGTTSVALSSAGAITQAGGTLTSPLLSVDAGSATLDRANAISALGNVDIDQTLILHSTQAIAQQTGARIVVGDTASFDAGSSSITLENADNDFRGTVSLHGGTVAIGDANALTLGTVTADSLHATSQGDLDLGQGQIAGNLIALANGGDIGQAGALSVDGTSELTATGAVILAHQNNDFKDAVSVTGGGITLRSRNDLEISAIANAANSALSLTAGGTLMLQPGPIDTGTASLTLSAGDGLVTTDALSGSVVTLHGGQGLTLGGDVTGTTAVALSSGQAITQTGGGISTALLSLDGGSATLDGSANAIARLGDVDLASSLTLVNSQAITQATGTTIAVDGVARFSAGNADIILDNAGNAFGDVVHLDGGTVAIANDGALTLGVVDAGSLEARSQGDLTLGSTRVTGMLRAESTSGGIRQTDALTVDGSSELIAAGGIVLDHIANDFVGPVAATGAGITLVDANDLDVSSISNTPDHLLSLTAGGTLTLSGAPIDTGTAALTLSAGDALSTSTALRGGQVALHGEQSLTLAHDVSAGQTLTLSSGGQIAQTGGSLTAPVLALQADTALLDGANAVDALGDVDIAGSLVLGNTHSLSQQAGSSIRIGGIFDLDAGGSDITLTGTSNDFRDLVHLNGRNIDIRDADTLRLGTVSGGSLRAQAADDLHLQGTVSASAGHIVLAAGRHFINQTGAQALDAPNGRWLIHLADPSAGHQYGGLDSQQLPVWNTTAFGAVPYTGNRYVFGHQPLLSFASGNLTKIYGETIDLQQLLGVSGLMPGVAGAYLAATSLSDVASGTPTLFSAGAAAGAPVTASPYTIDVDTTSFSTTHGYGVASAGSGTLSVLKAGLVVTANDGQRSYGSSGGLNGYSVSGLRNNDRVTGATLASAGTSASANVGRYTISVSDAVGSGLDNYDITYVDGTLTIGRLGLTITANNVARAYGGDTTFAGFEVDGLVNGDSVDSVSLSSDGANRTAHVGEYTIVASDASGSGLDNYDITYIDGMLTIGKAGLTITAHDGNRLYGQSGGSNGYTVDGLLNDDSVSGVSLSSEGSAATATVGEYAIHVADAVGTGLGNYEIRYVDGTLTIDRALLTITAGDASRWIGQAIPLEHFTAEGLFNNDRVDRVLLSSAGNLSNATPGRYAISAGDAVGAGLGNYDIRYVDGTLHVQGLDPATLVSLSGEVARHHREPSSLGQDAPALRPASTLQAPYRIDGDGMNLPVDRICDPDLSQLSRASCPQPTASL